MNRSISLITVVFCAVISGGMLSAKELPAACVQDCVEPYGEVLGKAPSGVEAFSNCNASCVIFDPARHQGTYTGIKWQCVEYARRWLLVNLGVVYGDVDVAADIWTRITGFKAATGTNGDMTVEKLVNGSSSGPRRGDLLIYGREYLGTGHVAVVLEADLDQGWVRVGEQNFDNRRWKGKWARQLRVLRDNGKYWILDGYLIGWVRAVK